MVLLATGVALAAAALLASQRFGSRRALPAVALLSVLILSLFDYFLGVAPLMGLAAGYQVDRNQPYGRVIAGAALPGALLALQLMAIMPEALPCDLLDEQLRIQQQQMESLGLLVNEEIGMLQEKVVRAGYPLLPGVIFFFVLLQAVLAYRVGHAAAGFAGVSLPAPLPMRLWRPWSQLIWVLVAGLAVSMIGEGWIGALGMNLILVTGILYAGQGLAVGRFFAHRMGVTPLLEVAVYAVLTLTFVGLVLLPLVGLLDTWFDWRRLEAVDEDADGDH